TRLSTMGVAEQTTAARHRRAEPPGLIHFIQGDLDWIVMKALEKDRNRRYETANGLAMDIQRHLNTEPVVARPPSRLYRFRKLARRNKVAFAAAAAAGIAFGIAGILSAWWAIQATRAEHAKSESLATAQAAETAAARERDSAKGQLYDSLLSATHAARLARQVGYRGQVFELLRQARAL